ncbi:MAG TPA: DUF6152 family protein [Candidatus Sulfotelmatobacter sp.]|jgi:Family of unknown function (DUF6152)|nr:DUF6152 family protein [Candidatus Sulfotelmatobacter sp.]
MKRRAEAALLVLGFLLGVPFLLAHHGLAQFDTTHVVSLQGTVTDFQWIQPHAVIHADLKDDKGKVANWLLELGSPTMLGRHGWSPDSLKRGDRVTVFGFRAKDGSAYMSVGRIELSDGKSLPGAP